MILQFDGVSYRYSSVTDWVLQGLNLSVSCGESVLVAGASGSGKSTFCRASTGLVPHFHGGELIGRVLVDGLDTRQYPVNRLFGHAGLVFQNADAQLFNQTVEAELAYGMESLGLDSAEIERRLAWVSQLLGIASLLGRPPHTLSGGEKQRVVLGAILSVRPRLLLLDEPFTHLDPEGAERLRTILRTVRKEGITVIVVEHYLHEVIADMDRLIVLYRGRVVADGPPRTVLKDDLAAFGLSFPPLVRLFRERGWGGSPLSIDEALRDLQANQRDLRAQLLADDPRLDFSDQPIQDADLQRGQAKSVVEMEGVCFSYDGHEALRDINLALRQGECVALVGRNGAGKTTLVKHMNGLVKPKQGRVHVLNHDTRTTSIAELARDVGFVWQNPNDQLFQANVREEVLTGPRVLGVHDSEWCHALFERFRLTPLLDRSPFRLSEGEKKRVAFATALAIQPELVVLDEPTVGQDEPFRHELGTLIAEWRAHGRAVVLVTHDLEFASEHAQRWLVLAEGRIVADGPPGSVMADSKAMADAGLRPTQRFQLVQALRRSFGEPQREALVS